MFLRTPANKTSLAMRKTLHGVGVNDSWYITQPKKGGHCPIYRKWHDMITRCHSDKFHIKHPTYADCSVCPEWFSFSNFLDWYEKNEEIKRSIEKYPQFKEVLVQYLCDNIN